MTPAILTMPDDDLIMLTRAYERGMLIAEAEGDQPRSELYLELADDYLRELTRRYRDQGMGVAQALVTANLAIKGLDPLEAPRIIREARALFEERP